MKLSCNLRRAVFVISAATASMWAHAAERAPTVVISADPYSVFSGHSAILTWASADATSCTASGGWSGTRAIDGHGVSTGALTKTTTFTITCTGPGGTATANQVVSIAGETASDAPSVSLTATPTSLKSGATATLTWKSTNTTSCEASGGWSGSEASDGTTSTNGITATTSYTLTCKSPSGSTASKSAQVSVVSTTTTGGGTAQRPSYNTGNGFFVLNGKLYDANGNEFRIRGVDRAHSDMTTDQPGISNSHANTVRVFADSNFGQSPADLVNIMQTEHINYKEVPIPTAPYVGTTGTTVTSCNTSTSALSTVVANWVATASTWTPLNKWMIVNIANEWGPSNSSTWASSYITAVQQMRAAGYLGTLLIDAGGCGQDELDIDNYAAQVLAADPQHNLMFAYHMYGATSMYQAPIASASGEVITLNSSSATHPFAPSYNGSNNSYSGISQMVIQSPSGALTTIPVEQNVGGVPGAWTVTATAPLPAIAAGSTLYDWANYQMRIPRLAALASQGILVAITEFGPGRDIGPSPTMIAPLDIIATAEANNVGWIGWAWDDNDLASCQSDNNWFAMTYNCGEYTQASDLTEFGQQIVLDPTYGLSVLATPASIF
jgi:Cellulase (glycosyl hydrolase family 5)